MRYFLILISFLIFGCSTQTPKNSWQYASVNHYKNFENYYLQNRVELAAMELKSAREYAKESSDLKTLASIELSFCALKVAMLEPFSCPKFDELKPLVESKELDAYESFLSQTLHKDEISYLPKQYQKFAKNGYDKKSGIKEIEPLTSKMIVASLSRENITITDIDNIINDASYHGYKNALIQWLKLKLQKKDDEKTRQILRLITGTK